MRDSMSLDAGFRCVPPNRRDAIGLNRNKASFFDGLIDEVTLFDRPLTAEETQSLFARKPSPAAEKANFATVKACAKP